MEIEVRLKNSLVAVAFVRHVEENLDLYRKLGSERVVRNRGWTMGQMGPCNQGQSSHTVVHPCLFTKAKWTSSLRMDSFIA